MVSDQGADGDVVAVVADRVEAGDSSDVDHEVGRQQSHLHQRKQAHPTRHHLGEGGSFQSRHRLVEAGRRYVVE